MKLLLKQVTISDKLSPFNGLIKDISIVNGLITNIADRIELNDELIIEGKDLLLSPGWVDIFSHFNDPGYEYKETLETGANAAAAGGFTNVFVLPNTNPAISNKSLVEYIVQKSVALPVNITPVGSITKDTEGKELAEMYDMRNSGAIAFSDGLYPVQTAGLFLKALQYAKAFEGVLIQLPIDRSIGKFGLMNEGITSTRVGLPGIPAVAEELMISRDIELAHYTQSKLHLTGISTAKSLALITEAKRRGISITCSVTPYHLFFCDEDLLQYDTNLKVDPPLRTRQDMLALRQGLEDGHIDCVASHHMPQDWDNKTCEFEYAKPGMIGLESCYSVINTILPNIGAERLADVLSNKAREIFSLNRHPININSAADITLFERETDFNFDPSLIRSKSKNSPFTNKRLKGKVVGIINKDKLYLNN